MSKPKQQYLAEEMKPVRIEEIVQAAHEYEELRDSRMELLKRETAAAEKLMETMKKHQLEEYYLDGNTKRVFIERIPGKEKVKVKSVESSKDEE